MLETKITSPFMRAMMQRGWTPPADLLEPYRPMLAAFYRGRDWTMNADAVDAGTKFDAIDINNILGIMTLLEFLNGSESGGPPAEPTQLILTDNAGCP
jgi:hypothetical protein